MFPPPALHRRRGHLGTAVAALLACVALAGCGGVASDVAAPASSQPAASATTSAPPAAPVVGTVNGGQVDFGEIFTQDTVLWFWAPW